MPKLTEPLVRAIEKGAVVLKPPPWKCVSCHYREVWHFMFEPKGDIVAECLRCGSKQRIEKAYTPRVP